MQKENAICNQMKYQLLGGSKNLKEANYKEQQNYHEQDIIDSYEQTINKKNRQEISSLINANLEENKIQVEFNETQYDEQNYSNTQQGEFGKLDKELNQLLQILCDKYLEIQKKQNQSLKMEKQKIQVEQKTEQPESTTIISQQSQTTSQLSDFQGICLSNQNSFSYFGQQGVKRFETIKEILESQQKNEKIQKNFSNKLQKNIDAYSEQFLRQIFQLGDHINSGGEADIFTHAYDESIAYRVIKLDEDEDLNEQLLELYSIKELQEQNILDLNTSHLVEDKDNDTKYIIHVMQKCQMSLQDEISSKKVFSLREILRFISTAFHLLIVLRQKYIYHSDIKPGNILKIDDNNYKLSDFGASQLVNFIDPFCDFKMYTPGFIPQNQSLDLPFYHDIYSFGKTIQKLLMQLENQSEISDCLNKFIDEEICKDDKNSINLDCFELPRKFINILMNFVNYEVIEAFLEEYLKQIEQYLVIKKENKIFQYESEYQYAEIAILIISYLRQDQTSIKIKALITKSYILCKRKQYEESLKCFNEIFRENFKDDSQSEILIKSITIVSKILIKLNNKTNLSQENQIKLIDLIKLANSDEMFDKLKIKIIELLLLKSSDIYPIIRDFYDSLKKQDENQELNMVYRIITKFIRYLRKQNCYDQSLYDLIQFIQDDKKNHDSYYKQKLLKEMGLYLYKFLFQKDEQLDIKLFVKYEKEILLLPQIILKCLNDIKLKSNLQIQFDKSIWQQYSIFFKLQQLNIYSFDGGQKILDNLEQKFKNRMVKIKKSNQLPYKEYVLYNKNNYCLKYLKRNNIQNYQFFNEEEKGQKEKQVIQSISLIKQTILKPKSKNENQKNNEIPQNQIETISLLNFIPYFDCEKISLNYIGSLEKFNEGFEQFNSQLYFGNLILCNLKNLHEKEKIYQEITNLNVEIQNKYQSHYKIEKEASLSLNIYRVSDYSLLNMPCFTFFTSNLSKIQALKLKFKFSPDIIYHFNTEIDTMMFYIDLFMKAKTLNNITKLTLDFSEYLINMGNNLAYIFESLQMCQKITELNLNFENDSEIDDDGAFIIAQTILRKSQDLVKLSLNLSKNQVKIEGVMSIANALENCQKLTSLELLLNDNFIGNEVTQQIENIIQKCQNLMELSLGLKCNLISDEGIYSIASALNMCQNIAKLSLNLSLNNIEIEGAMILASAFENCLKLTQLEVNLNKNYIGNDVTNCVLVIMQTCQNLTHLNLGLNDNFITDEGVQNIANAYTNSKNITEFRLYLNKNNITLKGASILTKALESNKNIQWLTFDLNGNCIEYEELHNLYQTFRQNMKNKMFNFQGNNSEEVEKLQEKYEVTQIVDYVKKNLSYQMNEKPQKYLDQNEKTTQLNITSSFEQTSNTNDFRSPNQLKMITLSEIYINWQTVFTTTAQNIAQYLLTKQQSQFDLNLFVQGSQLFSEDQCFKNCEQINKYVYFHGLSLMQNKQSQQIKDIEQKQDHEMEQLDLYLDFNIISSEAAQVIKNMLQQYKSNIKLNHQFNSYKNFDYETIMSALDKSAITLKIDLCQQGKSILNEGAQKIANTLAKCQNTTKLNLCLSECSIIDEATKIIAYNLRNCKNITELSLNLSSNKIGIQGAKYISDAIKHFRKAIQLDIDLNQNDIKEEGAQCIADALQNCQNITIFNLSLRKNKIGAESIKNIANSLEMFKKLSQVSLDLSQNKIGIDGTHYISRALINCYNVNQLSINLGENDIKDEGAKFIASALEKCENLADLKLSLKENHISSEGAKNILNALKSCNKITGLNIDFENNQIDGEGFNSVINSIFKCQKITHTSLNFNNNKIDVNVSLNVQNNDENSHNITQFSLDLGNNKISLEQAQNITNFLKKCKNLQKLNLNLKQDILNNAFGDDQIQIIANFLQNCQSLTEITLNLKNNKISAEGAKNIANALTKLQNLTLLNLDLCQNKIISEGIISITNALQQCQKISKLNLSFGQYFQESDLVNVFADSLANSENISELDLEFSANLNSQNAKNIYKVLEKCQNVTQLSLKFHYFKNLNNDTNLIPLPDNIQNLSGQLEKLQNITRLELSFLNADIGDEGAYYISRAFEKCQNITQLKLDFRFTQIEAKGVQEISSAIEKCQKITNLALNLSMNNIQDEGVLSISNTLEKCQNITELFLNLEQNRLSQKAINNLIMALERSQNITKLQFHFLDFSICFK
ncbi:kinase domain protein (macronuclear) [Tetrahymena thermophila SB210]|uniref:Kinase domain protein n=1 Tax=Tetrahymena thermophila (strain SB210) TaxID=312017 RepID=W7X5I7_TETTS|nr:kinase domain protein [Tetrahymena thermophila SB210]EWS71623.1 kinase domain protein [Tetrahymena thermophila SB210]|eukprot:XP_012655844.1 kinase domain protein [Tetrahymena thermophila SB210]